MKKLILVLFVFISLAAKSQDSWFYATMTPNYASIYKARLSQYITLTTIQNEAIDTLFGMLQGKIQVGSITNTSNFLGNGITRGYNQARFLTMWGNASANSICLPPQNYTMTYYNSPTHGSTGVVLDGINDYAVINVNPTVLYSATLGTSMHYYSQSNLQNTSGCDMGIANAAVTNAMLLYTGYLNANRTTQYCNPGDINSVSSTFSSGMFISNRSFSQGHLRLYGRDAALATLSNTSACAPFNTALNGMCVGGAYLDGTGVIQFSTHTMAYCGYGYAFDSNTDAIQYSKIINWFMTKLGINAY